MARLLCVNPWIYDFAAYNLWVEPLGLLAVAALLRDVGHDVALIDCLDRHHPDALAPRSARDRYGCGPFTKTELPKPPVLAHIPHRWGRYGLPVDVFEAELDAHPRPAAVLVTSMMTYWYPGPFEVIRRIKARWPKVPVALGGVYATLCSEHARAHSGADQIFCGADPQPLLNWIGQVAPGSETPAGPRRVRSNDLFPMPAHDLRRRQGFVAVLTARGCPFKCPYCAVHQLESPSAAQRFDPRRPSDVVDEIVWCVESLGALDVAFYDDALLVNAAEHIHPILDGVIARRLAVRLHAPNGLHARLIDLPLALKMRQAGFVTLRLGLESADPAQQRHDGGKVDEAHFANAVEALYAAGFTADNLAAYVLIARPGQHIDSVRATVQFAHDLGVPVSPAQYSPIPGTVEWQNAVAAGTMSAHADPLLHNNSIYPCANGQPWEALKQEIREQNRALDRCQ